MHPLVVCATPKELRHALACAGEVRAAQGEVQTIHTPGRTVAALACGVGPVNAAFHLGRALASGSYSGVINLGIAGAFDVRKHPQGSIAVSETEAWPEYGLGTDEGIDPEGLKFPLLEKDGERIFDRIALAPEKAAADMGLRLPEGIAKATSVTVAGVSGTPRLAQALLDRYAADLENMEGFALALGCADRAIPFLEIRSVSNPVGSRDAKDWDFPAAFKALETIGNFLFGV